MRARLIVWWLLAALCACQSSPNVHQEVAGDCYWCTFGSTAGEGDQDRGQNSPPVTANVPIPGL